MKPKESAECHLILSSQMGSGHETNPVSNHSLKMAFFLWILTYICLGVLGLTVTTTDSQEPACCDNTTCRLLNEVGF